MDGLVLGQQLSAGRALINVSQRVLACAAGLHVNSIRYLERQERITTAFSRERVEQAMLRLGVIFFRCSIAGGAPSSKGQRVRVNCRSAPISTALKQDYIVGRRQFLNEAMADD